jgi:hypothetical protein
MKMKTNEHKAKRGMSMKNGSERAVKGKGPKLVGCKSMGKKRKK